MGFWKDILHARANRLALLEARDEIKRLKEKLKTQKQKRETPSWLPTPPDFLEANRGFINRHSGQRAFVVANGSSLNRMNLNPLKKELCLSVNSFFVSDYWTLIQPRYHLFSGYGPHPHFDTAIRNEFYAKLFGLGDGVEVIVNATDKEYLDAHFQPHCSYASWLKPWPAEGSAAQFDPTSHLYESASVSVMALQWALVLGCNPIYLIGFDHDWVQQYIMGSYVHCYDHKKDPNYANAGTTRTWELGKVWKGHAELWNHYEQIKRNADAANIQIVNMTDGGLLDVFPRQDMNTLFPTE